MKLIIIVLLIAAAANCGTIEPVNLVETARLDLNGSPFKTNSEKFDWFDLRLRTVENVVTSFIEDPFTGNQDRIFTGGSSKDIHDISRWKYRVGSPQDKADIVNAYAALDTAANDNGRILLYFGSDRYANDGDTTMGLWFLQSAVVLNDHQNEFVGSHQNGDLLLVVDFGNPPAEFRVFEWKDNVLSEITVNTGGVPLQCDSNELQPFCVTTNINVVTFNPTDWRYTSKQNPPGEYPRTSFMEGVIDLSYLNQLRGLPADTVPCFATFISETRASNSVSSTLSDFALGDFNVCSLEVSGRCINSGYNDTTLDIRSHYEYTVENTGQQDLVDLTFGTDYHHHIVNLLRSGDTFSFDTYHTSTSNPEEPTSVFVTGKSQNGFWTIASNTFTPQVCPMVYGNVLIATSVECGPEFTFSDLSTCLHVETSGTCCNVGNVTLINVESQFTGQQSSGTVPDRLKPNECIQLSGFFVPDSIDRWIVYSTASGENPVFGRVYAEAASQCTLC